MLSLTHLLRSVEAVLPRDSVLLHLIQHDRPTATWLVALGYAHAGEPESVLAPEFCALLERVAQRYVALVAQPC